jgi:predicted RNase H-like HicB family nuclease
MVCRRRQTRGERRGSTAANVADLEELGAKLAGRDRARLMSMDNRYTGVFEQVGDRWIGHVEELPGCNVQERTLEEARESLKETVQLIVQANRELARKESEGHQVVREALAVPVE